MGSNVLWNQDTSMEFTDRAMVAAKLPNILPRNIYFVHATEGASTNTGLSRASPLTTLSLAYDKCVANKGDVIVLLPGHAATLSATAVTTLATAGVTVLGIGYGRSKPIITCGAGNVDGLSVTGANQTFVNIIFVGSSSQTSTSIVDIAAADTTFLNCQFEHGAGPLAAVSVSAGNKWKFDGCKFIGTADGPDFCVDVEAHTSDWEFTNCIIDYGFAGLDNAIIRANADSCPGGTFNNVVASGLTLLAVDFNSSTNATGDGIIANSMFGFIAGITASAGAVPVDVGGYNCVNVRWADVAAGRDVYTIGTTVT